LVHRAVIIEADEVDRLLDLGEIAGLLQRLESSLQQLRITPGKHRVERGPVPHGIPHLRGRDILGETFGRPHRLQVQHRADLEARPADRPKARDPAAMRQVLVMECRKHRFAAAQPRSMLGKAMAHHGMHHRLVERDPARRAIAESARDEPGVIGIPIGDRALCPAAAILQRLGQVPVVEADPRLDAGL